MYHIWILTSDVWATFGFIFTPHSSTFPNNVYKSGQANTTLLLVCHYHQTTIYYLLCSPLTLVPGVDGAGVMDCAVVDGRLNDDCVLLPLSTEFSVPKKLFSFNVFSAFFSSNTFSIRVPRQ